MKPYDTLINLFKLIESRKQERPANSYTVKMLEAGENELVKKLGEEFAELITEISKDDKERIISESSDFLYHLLIMLSYKNIKLAEVYDELESRGN
jgi:phosphoribosyl-ATP pyrophosphohydrolase